MTDSQACYVCETPVQLSEPDADGYVEQVDENNHTICGPCHEQIQALYQEVIEWNSSEDRDLLVDNAIAIGLRVGRDLAKL